MCKVFFREYLRQQVERKIELNLLSDDKRVLDRPYNITLDSFAEDIQTKIINKFMRDEIASASECMRQGHLELLIESSEKGDDMLASPIYTLRKFQWMSCTPEINRRIEQMIRKVKFSDKMRDMFGNKKKREFKPVHYLFSEKVIYG